MAGVGAVHGREFPYCSYRTDMHAVSSPGEKSSNFVRLLESHRKCLQLQTFLCCLKVKPRCSWVYLRVWLFLLPLPRYSDVSRCSRLCEGFSHNPKEMARREQSWPLRSVSSAFLLPLNGSNFPIRSEYLVGLLIVVSMNENLDITDRPVTGTPTPLTPLNSVYFKSDACLRKPFQ